MFGWRFRCLPDDHHHCSLGHASFLHSMHPSFGDGASLAGFSRERYSVLLRSLRGNVFGGHGFFEENVVWTSRSLILEKQMRGRDGPTERTKIYNKKLWTNEIYIVFQRIWVQCLIFVTRWTNMKSYFSIFVFKGWFGTRESRSSLESLVFGVEGTVWVLVVFFWDRQMLPSRWKRRSWLGMLIFEVEGTFTYLVSSLGIFKLLSSLLEEKVLILKAFFLER